MFYIHLNVGVFQTQSSWVVIPPDFIPYQVDSIHMGFHFP